MKVNGKLIELSSSETLYAFLVDQGYSPEKVAVEHNGHVVQRIAFQSLSLSNEDIIEIVSFVGGG